jgi:hypothetical protein
MFALVSLCVEREREREAGGGCSRALRVGGFYDLSDEHETPKWVPSLFPEAHEQGSRANMV